MANSTQIDELRLDIRVEDKSKGESSAQKVRALASAISRLDSVIRSTDLKGLKSYFGELTKSVKPLAEELKSVSKKLLAFSQVSKKVQKEAVTNINVGEKADAGDQYPDEEIRGARELTEEEKQLIQSIVNDYNQMLADVKEMSKLDMLKQELARVQALKSETTSIAQAKKLREQELKLIQQINTEENKGKGGGLGGFVGSLAQSFGRIAMYRAIRTIIKDVTQAMREGLQNFAQYSEETDKSLSNINNSVEQLKNTFGITLAYLIETLEPVIVSISDAIVDVINNLNMAIASFKGEETFSKAKKATDDYADSLKKTANLFSFDKFNVISGSEEKNPAEMFEEMEVPDALPETATIFQEIIKEISGIMDLIGNLWDIVKPIFESGITFGATIIDLINDVAETFKPLLDVAVGVIKGITDHISGALQIISGLLKLLRGDFDGAWESIKNGFIKMVNGIIDVINFLFVKLNPLTWLFDLFGVDTSNWGIPHIPTFASGGVVPNTGTLFYAGEAGAEAVYKMNNGQTGVANVEQMQQAFAGALDQRTNVLLSAIYNSLGLNDNVANGSNLTSFVNTIMPEIDAYNLRRGRV